MALVSDEDYGRASAVRWCVQTGGHNPSRWLYAYGTPEKNGRQISMHRWLFGAAGSITVDHANGNTLDNRRENLRIASHLEQMRNRAPNRTTAGAPRPTSYKGVQLDNRPVPRPWRARIRVNGKYVEVGRFATDIEAARAYDAAARKHFGEFARLNAA